jgi:hypothetical protein
MRDKAIEDLSEARMQTARRLEDGPDIDVERDARRVIDEDDGGEFSKEAMPAAFAACLFLILGLITCVVVALIW